MFEIFKTAGFREKSLWVSTAVMLYLIFHYFSEVGPSLFDGTLTHEDSFGIFTVMVIIVVILEVVGQVVLAAVSPKEVSAPRDERDRQISMRADSHASWMLSAGVITIAMAAMFREWSAITIIHALVLMLIAVEAISDALQIFYYRRGY
jgi:hypothetical protein